MAIITDLASCSTNPALNGPDGSTDLPSTLDDAIRYALSFIAQLRDGAAIPTGAILRFAGPNAPLGFVFMNGALLSRTTYANLFAYATAAGLVTEAAWTAGSFGCFSVGDGSTTFRVPDARGMFLRGLDQSRGIDTGRVLGVDQAAANAPHVHAVTDPTHAHGVNDPAHGHGGSTDVVGQHTHNMFSQGGSGGASYDASFWAAGLTSTLYGSKDTAGGGSHAHSITTFPSYTGITLFGAATGISIQSQGTEGRPRNLAYPVCIKY